MSGAGDSPVPGAEDQLPTWDSYVGSRARDALRFLLEDGAWESVGVNVQAQGQAEFQVSSERSVVMLERSADGAPLSDTHIGCVKGATR